MGGSPRRYPFWAIASAAAPCVTLLVPAAASAHKIVDGPRISGVPQEGQPLTAEAEWKGAVTTVTWSWQRCTAGPDQECTVITGATTPTYVPMAADVGFVLRVRLVLTADHGDVSKRSKATLLVQPTSTPPPPPEEPEPEPEPEPGVPTGGPPAPEPFSPAANPIVSPGLTASGDLRLMNPFPVVRISGRLTPSGAQVTRLSVRAPRGASTSVRCRGRSCPVRRFAHAATYGRLRMFERHLRAGTRLTIVVRKPARIGKWTTITIRRGAPPRRTDRCAYPGRGRPATCPAA